MTKDPEIIYSEASIDPEEAARRLDRAYDILFEAVDAANTRL